VVAVSRPTPTDYHTADGQPTCNADVAAYGLCRRDPGHEGDHYDANGQWFQSPEPTWLDAVAAAAAVLSDRDALSLVSAVLSTRPNHGRSGVDRFAFVVPSDDPDDPAPYTWYVGVDLADE
jgi:hypothetical protein